jgi:hypothetical protein
MSAFRGLADMTLTNAMSVFDLMRASSDLLRQDLLLCKPTLNPISPVANPCCNLSLKIGLDRILGIGDATALPSKHQIA